MRVVVGLLLGCVLMLLLAGCGEPPVWNLRSPEVDEETQREHVREIEALLEARYGDQLESVEVDFVIRRVYDDMLPWDWEVGVYAGEYALKGIGTPVSFELNSADPVAELEENLVGRADGAETTLAPEQYDGILTAYAECETAPLKSIYSLEEIHMGMGQPPDTPGGKISNRHGTFQVEDVYVVFGAGAERIVYWDRETGEYVCLPDAAPGEFY